MAEPSTPLNTPDAEQHEHARAEQALRHALQRPRLSTAQRQRHLTRVSKAATRRGPSRRLAFTLVAAAGTLLLALALATVLPAGWVTRQPEPLLGTGTKTLDNTAARPTAPPADDASEQDGLGMTNTACTPSDPADGVAPGTAAEPWGTAW